MNFALLGDDAAAIPLIEAVSTAGHRLVGAALANRLIASHAIPDSVPQCSWDDLLVDNSVEAILVAGDSDDVQVAAKQLASAGKPLLIVPRVAFGAACAYELSLIRDDSHVRLLPVFAHRFHPELVALSKRLAAGESGAIRRLQIDRELPASSSSGLSNIEIEAAALDDLDLLQWLGGRYDQVTAFHSGQTEQGCTQATITLAGANLADATWTARHGSSVAWHLTVETERGPITFEHPNDAAAPAALIAAFVANEASPAATWTDAVRVFDVLDAARRSLRRRRTIDLHFETLSERQQFKTQMTAMGCGLLVLTLILMLALLGLGSLLDSRDRAVRDAAAVGLLLSATDFEDNAAVFSVAAQSRLDQIVARLKDEPKSAYLEPVSDPLNPELDQRRRAHVVQKLTEAGVPAADHRTLIAPEQNSGWNVLMKILRLAWIAPLVLFLLLQGLILVAKPTSSGRS